MRRLEIIAHRGASRERPENSIAAFERAIELGADGAEFDIHRHEDGVLRVHHDPVPAPGASPPTLDEVLELFVEAKRTAYCELKGPNTAEGTLAAIARTGVEAAVHAFDHRQVAAARKIAPDVPRGILEISYPVHHLAALDAVAGRDLWRQWGFVDAALVQAAHAVGARIVAWTVNEAADIERFATLNIDAICTDDVALARRVLGR